MSGKQQDNTESVKGKNENNNSDNASNKDDSKNKPQEDDIEREQDKFIRDTEETETLIDPGNEHHHTDNAGK